MEKEDLLFFDRNIFKKTQNDLRYHIKQLLLSNKIPYTEECGNIYGINHKDSPLFISHLDTVSDKDLKNTIYYDNITKTLFRDEFILGADDRAGVVLILEHIKDINFLFTRDEEIGAKGAQELVKKDNFINDLKNNNIPCGIELDRKGTQDIIGSLNNYCCEDLDEEIIKVLSDLKYKVVMGVFTDVDYIRKLIPCVNLSVGYYNQHTKNEYLDLGHFAKLNKYILKLNEIRGSFKLPVYDNWYDYIYNYDTTGNESSYLSKYYKDKNGESRDYAIFPCECCKSIEKTQYIQTVDKFLCQRCLEELFLELTDVLKL